jgi:hypothetical protein
MMRWIDKCVPCKIGTMPMLVQVHGTDWKKMKVGNWMRIRYNEGGNWERVLLTRIDPDNYFMADR